MTTDWRKRLREIIAADPLASSGPPIEVSGVIKALDNEGRQRAAAMELKYNSLEFLGLSPRRLQLLCFEATPHLTGCVQVSLRFRYFRDGSMGAGSRRLPGPTHSALEEQAQRADASSEADFNDLP